MITESIKEYHSNPAVSRSDLMKIAQSPEKFIYSTTHPEEATEALLLGSTVHKLVLEPEDFDKEFAVEPEVNKRKTEGKEALLAFYVENESKTIISPKIYEQAKAMASAVLSDEKAKKLLSGEIEKSFYWTDEITGVVVKCRPDVVSTVAEQHFIVDLKTGTDVSTDVFSRKSIEYGYDVQAAMCKEGVEKETGIQHEVIYVAVEKEPPYAVNIMHADPLFLEYGKRRYREFLGIFNECRKSKNWYGYLGFSNEINTLYLPPYLLKEFM